MKVIVSRLLGQEDLNFLLTNRIPRRWLTIFMGWFEHGSTIIVFAPRGYALCEGIDEGAEIRMGRALMRLPEPKRN